MTVREFHFSKTRLLVTILLFAASGVMLLNVFLWDYLHIRLLWRTVPGMTGHLIFPLLVVVVYFLCRLTLRLLHRGPAVVIDEAGIRAWTWRGEVGMAWREVERARFENWGQLSLVRRRIGYIVLNSREGARIRIGSGEFRRRDWEAIYRIVRERLPSDICRDLPPLELPEEQGSSWR